ncbi:MAG: heparinase II/III family protein [Tropicimonas sp.]|uniref:heparinase II/III family protein n=1 Tax=Tropicimonas sp. TaxID=2067044 RepID=UPI003A870571
MKDAEGNPNWPQRRERLLNRLRARRAALGRPARGFATRPEPRTIGNAPRGRQLAAGTLVHSGHHMETGGRALWDLDMPTPRFEAGLHGFGWLDDLAAFGDGAARKCAQDWTWDWIARFGRGAGAGWAPDLVGRRLIRWGGHAAFLLKGRTPAGREAFFRAMTTQTRFLRRRWQAAPPGLPRFEALAGLICAGLALEGQERCALPAIRALSRECDMRIDAEGGVITRNPEELLEIFTLLIWAAQAQLDAGHKPEAALEGAVQRIAPVLRALRHADGALTRFHGGGRGQAGRLDQALAACGIRPGAQPEMAMGYARLAAGRTTLLIDAAPPPSGAASVNAHASTLAFEMTSARRPVVINCGPGTGFGETWRRAGRATPSQSTLGIDGLSSSRLGLIGRGRRDEILYDLPGDVRTHRSTEGGVQHILLGHDGYVSTHGLTHVRQLSLSGDGRVLRGEDSLGALSETDQERFARHLAGSQAAPAGLPFSIRFHLHPDAEAVPDGDGGGVSITLLSGEVWRFRHEGSAELSLEPSVYLEAGRLKPRATQQIVLAGRVVEPVCQIDWTLAKAEDTPQAIRDILRDDDEHLRDEET